MLSLLPLLLLAQTDFGSAGVVVPRGSVEARYTSLVAAGEARVYGGELAPGVLYFVADDIAVGGSVLVGASLARSRTTAILGQSSETTTTTSELGLTLTAAYDVRFSELVSWLLSPSVSGGVVRSSIQVGDTNASSYAVPPPPSSRPFFRAQLDAPILFHLGHVFVGAGPYLRAEVDPARHHSGFALTRLVQGVATTLGGWL